jgi:hypothetical protein
MHACCLDSSVRALTDYPATRQMRTRRELLRLELLMPQRLELLMPQRLELLMPQRRQLLIYLGGFQQKWS